MTKSSRAAAPSPELSPEMREIQRLFELDDETAEHIERETAKAPLPTPEQARKLARLLFGPAGPPRLVDDAEPHRPRHP